MLNFAERMIGAVAVPALLSVMAETALAEPPVQLTQRPAETAPAPSAPAQKTCLSHESANDKLRAEFGEKVLGRGVSSDGTLVEIFLSQSGTFTVIKTTPQGMSCVVDFGEGWQTINQLEQAGLTSDDLKAIPAPH